MSLSLTMIAEDAELTPGTLDGKNLVSEVKFKEHMVASFSNHDYDFSPINIMVMHSTP